MDELNDQGKGKRGRKPAEVKKVKFQKMVTPLMYEHLVLESGRSDGELRVQKALPEERGVKKEFTQRVGEEAEKAMVAGELPETRGVVEREFGVARPSLQREPLPGGTYREPIKRPEDVPGVLNQVADLRAARGNAEPL